MDFKDVIRMGLEKYLNDLRRALDGLTLGERRFQPTPETNHIDFIVWHMARTEDNYLHLYAQGTEAVWHRERWPERLGLPEKDSGFRYTAEQVSNLPCFDISEIMAYYDSVRSDTLHYLSSLRSLDLDACLHPDRLPCLPVGRVFSDLIVEESQHVGQVAYLRGLQRGINK